MFIIITLAKKYLTKKYWQASPIVYPESITIRRLGNVPEAFIGLLFDSSSKSGIRLAYDFKKEVWHDYPGLIYMLILNCKPGTNISGNAIFKTNIHSPAVHSFCNGICSGCNPWKPYPWN